MRFDTKQHKAYCGIELHARSLDGCILRQAGAILLYRNLKTSPEMFLKALAPSRAARVVAVEWILPWSWLADLCARAAMPFGLGHALSMQAIHGGTATNDPIDAPKIAGRLRGGLLPQASGYPAAMRTPRELLRRRGHLVRKRAELLTPGQQTTRQYHWPESGTDLASQTHRPGGAARFAAPAVPKSGEGDLALIDSYDPLLRDLELTMVQTATQHDATTWSLLQTVPGIGTLLRRVLLSALHALARCPRVQDCVSYCRLVTCAQESAGKRYGLAGTQIGNAYLTWAFAAAAVLLLRTHPGGQTYRARLATTYGQGKARTILAHQRARAIYDRLTRRVAFDLDACLQGSGRRAGEPAASLGHHGWSLTTVLSHEALRASTNACEPIGPWP